MIRHFEPRNDSLAYVNYHRRKQRSKKYHNQTAFSWGRIVFESMQEIWLHMLQNNFEPALKMLETLKLNQSHYEYDYVERFAQPEAYDRVLELTSLYALIEIAERIMKHDHETTNDELKKHIERLFGVADNACSYSNNKRVKKFIDVAFDSTCQAIGEIKRAKPVGGF